jgi:membrane protease subunit HflK
MADHAPRVINLNFNRPSAGQIAAIFMRALLIVLLIAVLLTSSYTVGAESEGVVLRFGKFLKTVEPGLHFKLPLGIDAVTVVSIRRQLKLEFGFSTPGYLSNPIQASQDPDEEKSMVTGDLNAALVEWVVQYRIEDPRQYLFDVRNPEGTLRDVSEAAMREVIMVLLYFGAALCLDPND